MSGQMLRAALRRQREELAGWQKGALGLLLLAVLANLALGALAMKERTAAEEWKEEYIQAETAKMEAVAARMEAEAAREEMEAARREQEVWAQKCAALPEYQYAGECVLTAYCCEKYKHICGTGTGLTATGTAGGPRNGGGGSGCDPPGEPGIYQRCGVPGGGYGRSDKGKPDRRGHGDTPGGGRIRTADGGSVVYRAAGTIKIRPPAGGPESGSAKEIYEHLNYERKKEICQWKV